jgi:hypothetical protein
VHRQAATVTQTAVTAEVHQPLDVHRHFTAQIAFDAVLADLGAQGLHLALREVLDRPVRSHAGGLANSRGAGLTDTVKRGQGDHGMLVDREIDSSDSRHSNVLPVRDCLGN